MVIDRVKSHWDRRGQRMIEAIQRCGWAGDDPLYMAYHDEEWGVPCHDDQDLFERLMLEAFQAGLSWITILRKRENFRRAFEGFDPVRVAAYGESEFERLLADPGIVRNRLKVQAAPRNAKAFLAVQEEFGSFDRYLWDWVDGEPVRHPDGYSLETIPATTPLSDAISKDLKRRGFTFVGSTIIYAYLQSVGVVDDHVASCFKFSPRDVSAAEEG
jgi:DNA-3-methyladenine glycosylase I